MKISSVRVQNFKAIRDSKTIKLGSLTAFVGYNGSGKSSVLEACEFVQRYALHGLERTLAEWYHISHIAWKGVKRKESRGSGFLQHAINIDINGKQNRDSWQAKLEVGESASYESGYAPGQGAVLKDFLKIGRGKQATMTNLGQNEMYSTYEKNLAKIRFPKFDKWLFLALEPNLIGRPYQRFDSRSGEPLQKSGGNLADLLRSFAEMDSAGFNAMIDAVQYVVPYLANLSPEVTQDLIERRSFLQMTEYFTQGHTAKLPGWVMSGGTLRLLALLTALRHPKGPSVLFVEELENGLDPRAIAFVIEEIRRATSEKKCQVIITTHSPYLLDMLVLEHIITVERQQGGPPIFSRPSEEAELQQWATKFAPGSLYSMGMLRSKERRVQ